MMVKRMLRYLMGSIDFALVYRSPKIDPALCFLTDLVFAGDCTDRKSSLGMVATFNAHPVHWKSSKQLCTSFNSMQADVVAAALAAKEATWLRSMM